MQLAHAVLGVAVDMSATPQSSGLKTVPLADGALLPKDDCSVPPGIHL